MLREKGKIIKWNDEKGFGFILPHNADGKKNIFVHIKSFTDRNVRPEVNQIVTYTIQNKNGKSSAIKVSRPTDNPIKSKTNINRKRLKNKKEVNDVSSTSIPVVYVLIILSFIIFLFKFSVLEEKFPNYTIIVYIFMGIITYFAYGVDKHAAKNNEYRISEKALLMLSLLGGWMGALIAQHKFRHKTKKLSFQIPFWISILANIILLHEYF